MSSLSILEAYHDVSDYQKDIINKLDDLDRSLELLASVVSLVTKRSEKIALAKAVRQAQIDKHSVYKAVTAEIKPRGSR